MPGAAFCYPPATARPTQPLFRPARAQTPPQHPNAPAARYFYFCRLPHFLQNYVFVCMGFKTTTTANGTRVTRVVATTPEWKLQASAVRALRAMPEFGRRFTLAGDMAAGRRGWQTATIAKATGLVKGEADLRVYLEGGRLGLIEYKAAKGRLSPEQKDRGALLARLGFGYQAIVKATSEADSAEQTLTVVRGWLAANDNQKVEG